MLDDLKILLSWRKGEASAWEAAAAALDLAKVCLAQAKLLLTVEGLKAAPAGCAEMTCDECLAKLEELSRPRAAADVAGAVDWKALATALIRAVLPVILSVL